MPDIILPEDVAADRPRKKSMFFFIAKPKGLLDAQLDLFSALHDKWEEEARDALENGNEKRAAYAYGWCAYLAHVITPKALGLDIGE